MYSLSINGKAIGSGKVILTNTSCDSQYTSVYVDNYYSIEGKAPSIGNVLECNVGNNSFVYVYNGESTIVKDIKDYTETVKDISVEKVGINRYKIESSDKALYVISTNNTDIVDTTDINTKLQLATVMSYSGCEIQFKTTGVFNIKVYILDNDNFILYSKKLNINITCESTNEAVVIEKEVIKFNDRIIFVSDYKTVSGEIELIEPTADIALINGSADIESGEITADIAVIDI